MIDTIAEDWPSMSAGGGRHLDYRHVRRLLFSALSRLAADGYAVPPSEGLDLVHDFLLEAWDGLSRRYDPLKGAQDTYIYGSFLRFARPRIGRLRRLRTGLAAPAEIAAMLDEAAPADVDDRRLEAASAWSALEGQPAPDRDLLTAYLAEDGPTERRLAADFRLTRYEMRLRLADAVGRVALAIGDAAHIPEEDRAIAVALWRDDRTPKEAAALLRTSVARVNEARQRVFARLAAASRSNPNRTRNSMRTSSKMPSAADLLISALRRGATKRDIAALADHREQILNWLDRHTDDLDLDAMPDDRQLADVYAVLGGEPPDGADDPFRASHDADDAMIGEAFADVLLPNLSDSLRSFDVWFAGIAPLGADEVAAIREEPSVMAGGEHASRLAGYGITPVTVAVASHALAAWAGRSAEAAGLALGGELIWEIADGRERPQAGVIVLSRARCIQEVGLAAELPDAAAAGLHDWLAAAAAYAPRLIDGFEAAPHGEAAVSLRRTDLFTSDLNQRWRGPDPEGERATLNSR